MPDLQDRVNHRGIPNLVNLATFDDVHADGSPGSNWARSPPSLYVEWKERSIESTLSGPDEFRNLCSSMGGEMASRKLPPKVRGGSKNAGRTSRKRSQPSQAKETSGNPIPRWLIVGLIASWVLAVIAMVWGGRIHPQLPQFVALYAVIATMVVLANVAWPSEKTRCPNCHSSSPMKRTGRNKISQGCVAREQQCLDCGYVHWGLDLGTANTIYDPADMGPFETREEYRHRKDWEADDYD
jgi:hypothetical protein